VADPNQPQCASPWASRRGLQPGNSGNPGNGNHQNGDY